MRTVITSSGVSCAREWVAVFLGSLALFVAPPVDGALYSCTESSGITVITDSPAQLNKCTLLSHTRPSTPHQPDPALAPSPHPSSSINASQAQRSKDPVLSVPLERMGSLFVVTVYVNGTRPAKMILDTGASHTILSFAVARDLSLWAQRRSTSMTMHTAGGTVQADVLPITSISIGDAEVRDLDVVIHDLPEAPPAIEGLLGLNVLSHFTVTIDGVRNQLLLGRHP